MKVVVVEGGHRDSSFGGLERSASLVKILKDAGLEAVLERAESESQMLKCLSAKSPDLVFCTTSHLPDVRGMPCNAHASLEATGFPFVGSSSEAIELVLSTDALKERWLEAGIPGPDSFDIERFLGLELNIREFAIALIGSPEQGLVLPAAASPVENPEERRRLESFARAAFVAAGVRDYARCNIIEAGAELFAMGINCQPMVPDRWFESCASCAGLGPNNYPVAIVLAAVARLQREGRSLPPIGDRLRSLLPAKAAEAIFGEKE
ncbi:MAG: hypothetical protein ABSF43_08660 [Rectinemataceae bacterium]